MLSFDVSPSENLVDCNRLGGPIECLKCTPGKLRRGVCNVNEVCWVAGAMLLLSNTWFKRMRETWWLNSELHEMELTSMLLMLDGMLLLLVKSDVACNWEFRLKAGSSELTLILVLLMLFGILKVAWYCLSLLVMLVKELVAGNVWDWVENSELNQFTLNSHNCSEDGTCVEVFSELLYSSRLPFVEAPHWFFLILAA